MGRQMRTGGKGENEELLLLLGHVRSRENALVFFLELFALSQASRLTADQYAVYKQEFLLKQKMSSQQIRAILEQQAGDAAVPASQLRAFWIKLKSILRVSCDRARSLGLLSDPLMRLYSQMLQLVDKGYEAAKPLAEYFFIQKLIKKRTLQTLIFTKDLYCTASFPEAEKMRSETFLRSKLQPLDTGNYSPTAQHEFPSLKEVGRSKEIGRKLEKGKSRGEAAKEPKGKPEELKGRGDELKSRGDELKSRGEELKSRAGELKSRAGELKSKAGELKSRGESKRRGEVKSKSLRALWQLEGKLADLMDVKVDSVLDVRKSQAENESALYDSLFARNIQNHKALAKYAHYCASMRRLLRGKTSSFSQARLNRRITAGRANQLLQTRADHSAQLQRPNTTKHPHSRAK